MSTDADRLAESMRAEQAVERARMESAAWLVYKARLGSREAEPIAAQLKQWLELHEGEAIADQEHGVYAELTRSSRTSWDMRPLLAEQVMELHRMGLLDIKSAAFDALRKAAPSTLLDGIQNTPGVRTSSESWSLQVRSIK